MENPINSDILYAVELVDGVLRLTLNDQKRRNALSENHARRQLAAGLLSKRRWTPAVRVIVLAANGPAFLCRS